MGQPPAERESLEGPGVILRRAMGLWRPRGRLARRLNTLLAAVTLVSIAFLVVCVALKLYADPPEELEQIALCGLVASLCVGFFFKASLFMVLGGTLRQTVRLLEDTRVEFFSGDKDEETRRRYQKLSRNIYNYGQMVAVPAAIGWITCPLLSRLLTKNEDDQHQVKRQFPVPVWFPFDVYASPTFECLYAVQSFCVLVVAECCISTDIFFVHTMLMVAAELEVLNSNLSAMGDINFEKKSVKEEESISSYKLNGRRMTLLNSDQPLGEYALRESTVHEWLHEQLTKNVRHHQAILRSVSLLQSAMDVSIFILLFVNMANLCASLFVAGVLVNKEGNAGRALNALVSIPALLYETTMYCIFGHVMTDHSERLMYSAFSCGWINSDARFKRSMLIFMMVTMQPMNITVGKTYTLSKQMLLQVLNGTYGLLNMMYHMHGSD